MSGLASKMVINRPCDASPRCTMLVTQPSATMGQIRLARYTLKAANVPTEIIPRTTCWPPTTRTIISGNGKHQRHARPQKTGDPDQTLVLVYEVAVHHVKRGHLRVFLAKGANYPHAGNIFAHPLRKLGIERLDFLKARRESWRRRILRRGKPAAGGPAPSASASNPGESSGR